MAQDQLRAFAAAGGQVLFGTDVGYMTDYDTADEYTYMQGAGMSAMAILASLTTAPAKRFGLSARTGRLVFRLVSLVSIEGRDAPAWQGATTENIGHI